MKTGNTYHTTATPIRPTDPEIRSILAAPLRHIRRRVKPTPPDGWCPVVGVYTSTAVDPRTGEAMPGPERYGAGDEDFAVPSPYGQPGDRLAGLAQEAIDWGLNGDKGYDLLRATATKSALKAALAQAGSGETKS